MELREELARLLARQEAEQRSNDGPGPWRSVAFEDYWNGIGLTERQRLEYLARADEVLVLVSGRA